MPFLSASVISQAFDYDTNARFSRSRRHAIRLQSPLPELNTSSSRLWHHNDGASEFRYSRTAASMSFTARARSAQFTAILPSTLAGFHQHSHALSLTLPKPVLLGWRHISSSLEAEHFIATSSIYFTIAWCRYRRR